MNDATASSQLAKNVAVLDAILWAKQAWDTVSPETIQKCFRKCRFGSEDVGSEEVIEIVGRFCPI